MSALRILAKAVKAKGLVIHLFSFWSFLMHPFSCRYNALTCSEGLSPCQSRSSSGTRCAASTWPLDHLNRGTYTIFLVAGCGSWCATIRRSKLSMLIWQEEQSTKGRKTFDSMQCVHLFDIKTDQRMLGNQRPNLYMYLYIQPLLRVVGPRPQSALAPALGKPCQSAGKEGTWLIPYLGLFFFESYC